MSKLITKKVVRVFIQCSKSMLHTRICELLQRQLIFLETLIIIFKYI